MFVRRGGEGGVCEGSVDKGCYSVDGEIQDHDLILSWSDGKQLIEAVRRDRVEACARGDRGSPPTYKDSRGGRRFKTGRTTGLHALRHYFASITLADGVNIKELSEYLGHHDPGFTLQTYTHMLPSTGGWRDLLCG